jgi:hypothetical protein
VKAEVFHEQMQLLDAVDDWKQKMRDKGWS